ncbi:MAG: LON peptidase substrate-binding domain-containing protein [Burkholderiaceae bacterium]
MTGAAHQRMPIFPLGTVLFPDGVLPLRIFEARYMDMVRDCLRDQSEFGVCMITHGNEVGQPADHEVIGCSARIENWDMAQLGLLNIRTRGTARFEVVSRTVTDAGLILAEVAPLPPEPDHPIPLAYTDCVHLLERIIRDLTARESDPQKRIISEPYRLTSASWVSYRLSELLPLTGSTRVRMLALDDPIARLRILDEFLRQKKVI